MCDDLLAGRRVDEEIDHRLGEWVAAGPVQLGCVLDRVLSAPELDVRPEHAQYAPSRPS